MIARPVDPKKGRKRQISGGGKNASAIVTQSQTPKRRKTGDAEPSFASAASKGTTAPTVTSSTRRQRTSTSAEAIDDSSSKDGDGGGITVTQPVGHYVDEDGKEIWICPACGEQYNHLPMICCDRCDEWYVWMCVDRYWPKKHTLEAKALLGRDGISDETGQDLEAGHPVGYSVILSQLQAVTRVPWTGWTQFLPLHRSATSGY